MIIDGLMPAAPRAVAKPALPPKGLMEAANAVGRLEQLREAGLITSDEYTKERAAIERALQPGGRAPQTAKPASKADAQATPRKGGPQPGVHIASFKTRRAASRGWSQLRRAHRALLGKFRSEIKRVNLGPGKGTFYRLTVGPLKSQAAATQLCRRLKRRRQYCEPGFIGSG